MREELSLSKSTDLDKKKKKESREFLWKFQRVNKRSLPWWHTWECSSCSTVQNLILKMTYLDTASLTIHGRLQSVVWYMLQKIGLCESHWCITLLHLNQIKLCWAMRSFWYYSSHEQTSGDIVTENCSRLQTFCDVQSLKRLAYY